jgi:NAD(P)-dependent dehydrogenase (short-subunit alcohol dehydrogenase family)
MASADGPVVAVTGGASGIGLQVARDLVAEGARVVIAGRGAASVARAVEALGAERCEGVVADVGLPGDNARIVEAARSRFGGLDAFVANAGISIPLQEIEDLPVEAFDRVMAVNTRGVFLGLQAAIPALRERGGGSIVIVASIGGIKARGGGNAAYIASKHAAVGLMRTAAVEAAPHGIRVNAVLPGPTDTEMIRAIARSKAPEDAELGKQAILRGMPLARYGTVAEVASLVVFLVSARSGFCTGGVYPVDGGLSAV